MKHCIFNTKLLITLFFVVLGCASNKHSKDKSSIEIQQGQAAHEKLQKDCKILQEIQASGPDQKRALEAFKNEAAETGATHGFLFSSGEEDSYVDKSQFEFYEESVTIYGEAFECS